MISFWERQSFIEYDFVIIGSGIVGLSTAISIKEARPNSSVLILEKSLFPTGASTKNAGFACFGSLTELLEDLSKLGQEKALELVETRIRGLDKLIQRVGETGLDYKNYGGYELLTEQELPALEHLEKVNQWLSPLFKNPVFQIKNELIQEFGFNDETVKSLVYNPYEGQLDSGKMIKSLLHIAQSIGIETLTGAEAIDLEDSDHVIVSTQTNGDTLTKIKAGKVGVCTNAFSKTLIPELELTPGRGLVLITEPIENLKFKGAFHIEQGYYYFRNFENRVIFGGGRNLFMEEEATTEFAVNQKILEVLKDKLSTTILPYTNYDIDMTWTGIMAFGETKQPILQAYSDQIFVGVRLGGMGVAIGSSLGEKLANMMLGNGG